MDTYSKKMPAVQVHRLDTFSEKKSSDFGAKLRKTWTSFSRRPTPGTHWTPPALHPFTLSLAVFAPLALLVILQLLLNRSQRDNGLIFAPDINALPLSRTFLYQYFPTIIAVIFSMFWSWIDLEVKRLEPYYRLSRPEGALGKDSLLLCYPFSFMPFVPIRAFRDTHWAVFWASLALVLVTWGLVPIQAGLFSTRHVMHTFPATFNVSQDFIPADEQPSTLTLAFAQSAYSIVTLNETLPPYMTREYTLDRFTSSSATGSDGESGQWTAPTTLYGLDLSCEPAIATPHEHFITYRSTTGCELGSVGLTGNETRTPGVSDPVNLAGGQKKGFSAMYAGYWRTNDAQFYIDVCPPGKVDTFYAAFARNKEREEDPPQNVTAIFCEPMYYELPVNATVDSRTKQPIDFVALGPKRQLPVGRFNTTWLEQLMNGGVSHVDVRGDTMPDSGMPSWRSQLVDTDMTEVPDNEPMVSVALIIDRRPLADYLDWQMLAESYQKAWRLLFARAMVDTRGPDSAALEVVIGTNSISTNAVVLDPVFTYIVEALLGFVSVLTLVLLYISMTRAPALRANPNSIASAMSLVAENESLLADFAELDCCTTETLRKVLQKRTYRLICMDEKPRIIETSCKARNVVVNEATDTSASPKTISKPVRPVEFSKWVCIPLATLFAALCIGLAVLFVSSRQDGLPLPSNVKIVQSLVENYIPTAVATLIEPTWVLFNRLLCLLQPIEELQSCKAKAKESIDLDYSSLPPQLVLLKALRARHLVLAAVCTMALLANLLAVALAGLFFHEVVEVRRSANFRTPFEMSFVSINGSVGPVGGGRYDGSTIRSGAYRGGQGKEQFLIAESNYTRGTPLPAWTNDRFFYMPFTPDMGGVVDSHNYYEADTTAIGAEIECSGLEHSDFHADLSYLHERVNVTLARDGVEVGCESSGFSIDAGLATGIGDGRICLNGLSALELSLLLEARSPNASLAEKETCWGTVVLGWLRSPEGPCNVNLNTTLDATNSIFVQCRPKIMAGKVQVQVDAEGQLLKDVSTSKDTFDDNNLTASLSSTSANLIGQSNRYIFQMVYPTWHNDSSASDCINYFASRAVNNSRLLDPRSSLPTLAEVQVPLSMAYSRLFAIWLGINKEELFVPQANGSTKWTTGWSVAKEERLFLSTPMFAIAEAIFAMYAVVAILVYLRRPGEYLPRLPTSIASVVGLFAASGAVRDMVDTSHLGSKERVSHFEKLDARYGYGNYVGVDGLAHIGIEKMPFVRRRIAARRRQT